METKTNKENEQELLQQPLDENELDQVAGGGGAPPVPPYFDPKNPPKKK